MSRAPRAEKTMAPRDRHQVSLMHVFRSAHAQRDSRKDKVEKVDGDRTMTERSKERRTGTDEETLRKHLAYDMGSLMNTVNLDATVSLADVPYVARSVVNYGFDDLSHLSDSDIDTVEVTKLIKRTLMTYEPRLIPDTIEVKVSDDQDESNQRITFDITAEMVASPADIPLSFVAEIDQGAGKIQMTRLKVQT